MVETHLLINQSFGWMLNDFNNPFVAVACGAIGSILLVELCKRVRTISLLKFCGQNSLVFFSTHYLILRLVAKILNRIGVVEVEMVLNYFLMVVICALASILMNRYLPFFVGKKGQKHNI